MTSEKLYAFGVASALHGREYYERLWEEYRSVFDALGIKSFTVFTNEASITEQASRIREADALFIAVLTGGSSRLVKKVASLIDERTPIVLLAHGFHNSLASALGAKSRLEEEKHRVYIIESRTPSEAIDELAVVTRAIRGLVKLKSMRVVQLFTDQVYDEGVEASRIFGFNIESVTPQQLDYEMQRVNINEIRKYLESHFDLGGVDESLLEKPARLALAAERIAKARNADVVVIDCFPFIRAKGFTPCLMMSYLLDQGLVGVCEADYRSLILMVLAKQLTGRPGWIANPSHYEHDTHKLILAHCTGATILGEYATLLPHFETGKPYAVLTKIKPGTYTLAGISPGFRRMGVALAEVIESGMLTGGRCRTQVVAKLEEKDPRPFPQKAVSNHHVLIPGDVRRELTILATLAGMEVVQY